MTVTVITAPSSTDLTTLAMVKSYLDITDSSKDTILSQLIKVSSAQIVSYCGRDFAQTTVDEALPSEGGYRLVLSGFPVTTLTSVKYKTVAVDTDEYYLNPAKAGFLDNTSSWENTDDALDYVIRYTYGYILPSMAGTRDLPYDVEQAAVELTKINYLNKSRDTSISKEDFPQVYSVDYGSFDSPSSVAAASSLPLTVAALLAPYRRYKVS